MEYDFHAKREIQKILEDFAYTRKYSKGDIIYHQGDRAVCFYYLKKGRVRVYMTSPDGDEKTLSTASRGEILGEAAFFDKLPRISSASAMTSAELVSVNEDGLLRLIRDNPRIALELLEMQSLRIRQLSGQIDAMTFLKADGRIARLLLQNMQEENGVFKVRLTHEEIAWVIGVTRVTVSKILNAFKKDGILKTEYRQIIIQKPESLEAMVE